MLFLKCTNISRRSNVQELLYTRDNLISGYTHLALPVVKTVVSALQRRSILGGQVCVGSNGHAFFPATMNNRRTMNTFYKGGAPSVNMPSERECMQAPKFLACIRTPCTLIHKGLVESPLHVPLECVGAAWGSLAFLVPKHEEC